MLCGWTRGAHIWIRGPGTCCQWRTQTLGLSSVFYLSHKSALGKLESSDRGPALMEIFRTRVIGSVNTTLTFGLSHQG